MNKTNTSCDYAPELVARMRTLIGPLAVGSTGAGGFSLTGGSDARVGRSGGVREGCAVDVTMSSFSSASACKNAWPPSNKLPGTGVNRQLPHHDDCQTFSRSQTAWNTSMQLPDAHMCGDQSALAGRGTSHMPANASVPSPHQLVQSRVLLGRLQEDLAQALQREWRLRLKLAQHAPQPLAQLCWGLTARRRRRRADLRSARATSCGPACAVPTSGRRRCCNVRS